MKKELQNEKFEETPKVSRTNRRIVCRKYIFFEKLEKSPPPMAAMVAGPMMDLKKEEKTKMYPEEWWWAERQVSEVLAEHPGELVKTGEKRI